MLVVPPRAGMLPLLAAGLVGALAGCGGARGGEATRPSTQATRTEVGGPPAPASQRPPRPVLIAALGDSITAGSPLWDPSPRIRGGMGEQLNPQSQYEYWARRRLGPNARFRNCGVFGETTAQIAARLEGCARGADTLIVQGGINDVYRPIEVEASAAHLRAMVRRGRALGLRVALADVLPWNNGGPRYAPKIAALNRLIAAIARAERVPLLAFHDRLADPADPARMRADWTIDGDHPSVTGYRRLGEIVALP